MSINQGKLDIVKKEMARLNTDILGISELNCTAIVKWSEFTQFCPTLCDPMDYSPPGSSVHGIFQARILEWVAISFSRGSSRPRDRTWVSHIASRCFTIWATKETGKEWVNLIQLPITSTATLYPGGSAGKESICNSGDLCSLPDLLGRVEMISWWRERLLSFTPVFWPGVFHGLCIVHGFTKSWEHLNNFHFTLYVLLWAKSFRRNRVTLIVKKKSEMKYLGGMLKTTE